MPKYTPEQRITEFWRKVDKSAGENNCWLWTAVKTSPGYGLVKWRHGSPQLAHRISFELAHGSIPSGMCVLHACDNPSCVNPSHLWLGTHQDNMDDMVRKGRHQIVNGENHRRKLTNSQVVEIHQRYAAGETNRQRLAAQYGVHRHTISRVLSGQTWKSISPINPDGGAE